MNPILTILIASLFCIMVIAVVSVAGYFWWQTRGGTIRPRTYVPPPIIQPPPDKQFDTFVDEHGDGHAWLDGIGGMVAGQRIRIRQDENVMGRSRVCDIQFHDPKVSRQHAMLRLHNGRYFIQDMQSSRGTMVNGEKIDTHLLKDGDQIRLGDSILVFHLPSY